jgi:hypothetical protein
VGEHGARTRTSTVAIRFGSALFFLLPLYLDSNFAPRSRRALLRLPDALARARGRERERRRPGASVAPSGKKSTLTFALAPAHTYTRISTRKHTYPKASQTYTNTMQLLPLSLAPFLFGSPYPTANPHR